MRQRTRQDYETATAMRLQPFRLYPSMPAIPRLPLSCLPSMPDITILCESINLVGILRLDARSNALTISNTEIHRLRRWTPELSFSQI